MSETLTYVNDEPTLSEFDGIRYLHFGTEWVQGAMRITKPTELVLAYTQQMMAWLLFIEPSRNDTVAILGLGAGSLLRYTLKNTPVMVETVEWNPQVTAICRAYFRLPAAKRSVINHQDAAIWVQDPNNIGRFSVLLVDLYDADAQGPVRDSLQFYQDCYHCLAETGVMVVNLFGNHDSFPRNLDNIRAAFQGRYLELPEIDAGNRVVLAFKGPLLKLSIADFLDRAEQVETQYGLPAIRWARALLEQRCPNKTVTI